MPFRSSDCRLARLFFSSQSHTLNFGKVLPSGGFGKTTASEPQVMQLNAQTLFVPRLWPCQKYSDFPGCGPGIAWIERMWLANVKTRNMKQPPNGTVAKQEDPSLWVPLPEYLPPPLHLRTRLVQTPAFLLKSHRKSHNPLKTTVAV